MQIYVSTPKSKQTVEGQQTADQLKNCLFFSNNYVFYQ